MIHPSHLVRWNRADCVGLVRWTSPSAGQPWPLVALPFGSEGGIDAVERVD